MAVKNFTKQAEFVSSQILSCLFLVKNAAIFRNEDLGRKEIRRRAFTPSSIKGRLKKVPKSMMHVQSCFCFTNKTNCFSDVPTVVFVVVA